MADRLKDPAAEISAPGVILASDIATAREALAAQPSSSLGPPEKVRALGNVVGCGCVLCILFW